MPLTVHDPAARVLSAPTSALAASPRLAGVDVLRGAVMVLMALDLVRVYFSAEPLGPLTSISAELFAMRWVTHFCAPVFVFLAGAGARLHGMRVTRGALARYLATRGAWLILLELTVIRLGWTFNLGYGEFLLAEGQAGAQPRPVLGGKQDVETIDVDRWLRRPPARPALGQQGPATARGFRRRACRSSARASAASARRRRRRADGRGRSRSASRPDASPSRSPRRRSRSLRTCGCESSDGRRGRGRP